MFGYYSHPEPLKQAYRTPKNQRKALTAYYMLEYLSLCTQLNQMGSIRRHFSEGDFTKYLKNKLDDIQNNKAIKLDLLMCDYKDDMKEIKRGYEIL